MPLNAIVFNIFTSNLQAHPILSGPKYLKHPYGLVHMWENKKLYFYWTEFMTGQIKRAEQDANANATSTYEVVRNESFPLHEIRLYDLGPLAQSGTSLCSEHDCSQLCLTVPDMGIGRVCACTNGYELQADNKTCKGKGCNNTIQCGIIQYNTIQYNTIQCHL